jgi:hypothetical protein
MLGTKLRCLVTRLDVNGLMKKVKKKEVRKQGKKSCSARRPLHKPEVESTVARPNEFPDRKRKYVHGSYSSQVPVSHGRVSRRYVIVVLKRRRRFEAEPAISLALLAKMCWSKTVLEERDAPDQIVIDRRHG